MMQSNRRHFEFKVIVDESIFGDTYGPVPPFSTVTIAAVFPFDSLEGAEKVKEQIMKGLECPGRSVTVVLTGLST